MCNHPKAPDAATLGFLVPPLRIELPCISEVIDICIEIVCYANKGVGLALENCGVGDIDG